MIIGLKVIYKDFKVYSYLPSAFVNFTCIAMGKMSAKLWQDNCAAYAIFDHT